MPATKEQLNRALASEIKAAYVREGMTASEVAEKAGFSVGTMTRLMAGQEIPVSRLYLIADAIPHVTVLALIESAIVRAERD